MFKYILEGAGNINWMAIAALLTFMVIFITSAVMAFRSKAGYLDKMAHMPLEDSTHPLNVENDRHEK
ncbi:MAG: hypothetical protein GVY26_21835 [Bacteroidetes bacterium]|jgi:hypothetical protein|nr:hypothetical protein [Bacteroidota bacterium]